MKHLDKTRLGLLYGASRHEYWSDGPEHSGWDGRSGWGDGGDGNGNGGDSSSGELHGPPAPTNSSLSGNPSSKGDNSKRGYTGSSPAPGDGSAYARENAENPVGDLIGFAGTVNSFAAAAAKIGYSMIDPSFGKPAQRLGIVGWGLSVLECYPGSFTEKS